MAMKIEELLKSKRQEILAIAARHGVRNIRVFGSVARGEASPDSDVDILVEMESGTSLMDHVTLDAGSRRPPGKEGGCGQRQSTALVHQGSSDSRGNSSMKDERRCFGNETESFSPKTSRGRRLLALQQEIIAAGIPLLSPEEIEEEIRERRGEMNEPKKNRGNSNQEQILLMVAVFVTRLIHPGVQRFQRL